MKFDVVIENSHMLKKNGYKILKKMHKIEKKKGAQRAYNASFEDTYFFVLMCYNLVKLIEREYEDIKNESFVIEFKIKSNNFLLYLMSISKDKRCINKKKLSHYLKAYTKFFKKILSSKCKFVINEDTISLWNEKVLMSYIATWGNN